jgi:arylsulfatase A-like enzyme
MHLENAHYRLEPRDPRRYDPSYEGRFRDRLTFSEHEKYYFPRDLTSREQEHVTALYDSCIRDADDELREILADLSSSGQWDDTIIVVTADHGTNLGQHGVVIEHVAPYDAVVHVPLVIAWGDHLAAGHQVPQHVQLVDLLPTLLSIAGASVPFFIDGHDFGDALHGGPIPERPAFSEMVAAVFSLYRGSKHLLRNTNGLAVNHGTDRLIVRPYELYDLATDPNEEHDLSKSDAALVARTSADLEAEIRRWEAVDAWGNDSQMRQAAIHALREAGYLHDFSIPPGDAAPRLAP